MIDLEAPEKSNSFPIFLSFSKDEGRSTKAYMIKCNGVLPSISYEFGLAPSFIRACTFFIYMLITAKWRGVAPLRSFKFIDKL